MPALLPAAGGGACACRWRPLHLRAEQGVGLEKGVCLCVLTPALTVCYTRLPACPACSDYLAFCGVSVFHRHGGVAVPLSVLLG